jgi:hypothetical protein
MPINAYPNELTDPFWKKLEKKINVSSTGIGQTLRQAETLHKAFLEKVNAYEKDSKTAAAAKKATTDFVKALAATEAAVNTTYTKLKAKGKSFDKDPSMKVLDRYLKAFDGLQRDAAQILTNRTVTDGIKRYNERLAMWAKFVKSPT